MVVTEQAFKMGESKAKQSGIVQVRKKYNFIQLDNWKLPTKRCLVIRASDRIKKEALKL